MREIGYLSVKRADIVVLRPDDGEARSLPNAATEFEAAPFSVGLRAASRPGESRLAVEASEWALCRARRLRLEEQLALQEEFRMVDSEAADEIRGTLSEIERRVGDAPVEQLLGHLNAVQRMLYDDSEEREWW